METEDYKEAFLDHVKGMIDYWINYGADKESAVEGVAFSILVAIDGESSLGFAMDLCPEGFPEKNIAKDGDLHSTLLKMCSHK